MSVLRGRNLAMYLALCAVWGSTWLAIKIGLQDLPPLRFAGIRMGLACLLLTPFAWRAAGGRLTGVERRWIVINGCLQIGLQYACIFLAEQWIESGLAALLFATFPISVGIFAHALLPGERWTRRTVASALLGLSGVGIIEGSAVLRVFEAEARPLVVGSALMLLASLAAGFANVMNKKHLSSTSPQRNVWGQTLIGSSMLLGLAFLFERGAPARWTPTATGALLYLAIFGTALPFVGLFWLIPRVPVAVIGTIPVVDTVIAMALGSVVLGETFSPRVLAGGAVILGAVLLAASPGRGARVAARESQREGA